MNNANILKPSIRTKLSKSKAIFLLFFALFGLALFLPTPAKAASFEAGRIIDDSIFVNKNSMSVADIQNFLNSKVPTCDRWHAGFTGSSGTVYSPPWTCLKEYNENPTTQQNNIGQFNPDGSPVVVPGGLSAAQIIWNAAQTYSINPQVILVTLQKETGLITDDWAASWQYRTAMGFGCPDGAPCDAQWFGFANQVTQGTRHFRNFFDGVRSGGFWTPRLPGVNTISYNPNSACGSSSVNITTRAAAALYSYTPYQPNAAALNNLYGTGDACSAYGNRNFWRDFTGWFGSTVDEPYQWESAGQEVHKYATGENIDIASGIPAGERVVLVVKARNTGNATWLNNGANPVRIGTSHGNDRASVFCDTSWIACHRPVQMLEASVAPGQIGTFQVAVQAPATPGDYNEYYNLLVEGNTWMNDINMFFRVRVNPAILQYSVVSDTVPTQITGGSTVSGIVTLKNTGNTNWFNGPKFPVRLGTTSPPDRTSVFYDSSWVGSTRLSNQNEFMVAPGQNATFNVAMKAPNNVSSGNYTESLTLVMDGVLWFPQNFTHNMSFQQDYDASLNGSSTSVVTLGGADTATVTIKYLNTGLQTWTNTGSNQVRLSTVSPDDRQSGFCAEDWLNCTRAANLLESSVAPGQIGTFQFKIAGRPYHNTNPNYYETFRLVKEGVKRFGPNAVVRINFTRQSYSWSLTDQYAFTDATKTTPVNMGNLIPGQTIFIGFKAKNNGSGTWYKGGLFPTRVGTAHSFDHTSVLCDPSWIACHRPASLLEPSVAPGLVGTFEFLYKMPNNPGTYTERYDLLIEGYQWLNDIGLIYISRVN